MVGSSAGAAHREAPADAVRSWRVRSFRDPAGTGGDGAGTAGLAAGGLPELQLPARPSHGGDPGEDWVLGRRDCRLLLDELAGLVLTGRLRPGDVLRRDVDGGAARLELTLGPPVDAATLCPTVGPTVGPPLLPAGTPVLPVRWSLGRQPVGACRPPEAHQRRVARSWLRRLADSRERPGRDSASSWPSPGRHPDFAPEQEWGPMTPVVHAFARAVTTASPPRVARFLARVSDVAGVVPTGRVVALATAAARPVGRTQAVAGVDRLAELVADDVLGDGPASPAAAAVLRHLTFTGWRGDPHAGARGLLLAGIRAALSCLVVVDVAGERVRWAALGPWLAAASPSGLDAGGPWVAPAPVLAQVRGWLAPLGERAVDRVLMVQDRPDSTHQELVRLLRGIALTHGLCTGPASTLLEGTPAGEVAAALPGRDGALTELACCLAVVLGRPELLAPRCAKSFLGAFGGLGAGSAEASPEGVTPGAA
jgi:hypothetical protein